MVKPFSRPLFHNFRDAAHWLKKPLVWVGLAVLLGFSIVWFSPSARTQEPIHISLLTSALDAAQGQNLVKAFEAENPDIKIDVVEGPNASNLIEDLYTSSFLLGDSPYDLVMMDIVWLPKFAAAGWLMDLTDRLTPEDIADLMPGDLAGGRYQDRLYRLPIRSDGGMIYYRQDLLEQAGIQPPTTFDQLITAAKQLQESKAVPWGYVWQGRQYEGLPAMFVEVLAGFGGFWVDPKTQEVGIDRPEAVRALQFLKGTIDQRIAPPGVTTFQEEETRRLFQNGQVAFLRNWPYVYPLASADDSPVKGKFAVMPMVHAEGFQSGACLGGWGIGIAKSTPHPEAAWRVAQFYASAAAQKMAALENGYLPTRRSVYADLEVLAKYPYFASMQQVVERAVLRPPIAQYAQASDILQRYLSAALTERMSLEAALQAAAQETRSLLKT
ncbi:ABC transporter substrate-binding protein [Leptolyngbya ohadii]|uniref:ABC transporter substrate-binding protein n=1 Tax=Leptolyngbya ohadii TaxID=1962290 RepID=UPI000B5A1D47|nr:ABC transporter substrate-binding protein [Leptolyngbya ohadii]